MTRPSAPPRRFAERAIGLEQSGIREVTRRVRAVNGVNLGQGTCELPPPASILLAAQRAIDQGYNFYTLFDGVPPLKSAIAERYRRHNGLTLEPEEILVTQGATGGLECASKTLLDAGDAVVMFEPIYAYHTRLIKERGAVPRYVRLRPPDWRFDPDELEAALSRGAKMLVLANPQNPTGRVFTRQELEMIGDACRRHGVIAVVDEVYEYILGEGREHISMASLPGMFEHTITLSSASKTFFVTGWRVGWAVGPRDVLKPMGIKSDETYICAPAPFQYAVAEALQLGNDFFAQIRRPFIQKRERLCRALRTAGLEPYIPEGAYYVLADYRSLGYPDDQSAMEGLIAAVGVGAVPGREFFRDRAESGLLRFCFALDDEILDRGCALLNSRPLHYRGET